VVVAVVVVVVVVVVTVEVVADILVDAAVSGPMYSSQVGPCHSLKHVHSNVGRLDESRQIPPFLHGTAEQKLNCSMHEQSVRVVSGVKK